MNENYNVSNMEIRQYLANKRIAHQKAIEQIDAALTLFEEAEGELSKKLPIDRIVVEKVQKIQDIIGKRDDLIQRIDKANQESVRQTTVGIGKLPDKVQPFVKIEKEMSVEDFLRSLKILRVQQNKSQVDMGFYLGIGGKGYSHLEGSLTTSAKISSLTTKEHVIKLAKFFNIALSDKFIAGGWTSRTIKVKKLREGKSTNITTAGVPIKRSYKKRNREPAPDDSSA